MNKHKSEKHNNVRHYCVLFTNLSSTFLSSAHKTEAHGQIAFVSIFISRKKKSYFTCFAQLIKLQTFAVQSLNKLDTTLNKEKAVSRVNFEKLKVSSWKSCLYRLIKLKTPFRSFISQSRHLRRWLPKVAELVINTLSEQGVAKSNDNDVFIFDSPSAILKMERRKDEPKSTAHEQPFFRRASLEYE